MAPSFAERPPLPHQRERVGVRASDLGTSTPPDHAPCLPLRLILLLPFGRPRRVFGPAADPLFFAGAKKRRQKKAPQYDLASSQPGHSAALHAPRTRPPRAQTTPPIPISAASSTEGPRRRHLSRTPPGAVRPRGFSTQPTLFAYKYAAASSAWSATEPHGTSPPTLIGSSINGEFMLTFQKLWDNHPGITGKTNPCATAGVANYPDQCAISIGVALVACGVNTKAIPGVRHCWHHKSSAGHILAAEELAKALTIYPLPGLGRVKYAEPAKFKDELSSQRGLIFFEDYWRRTVDGKKEDFRNRTGDHIDLWNGSRLTDWFSWVRIQAGFSLEGQFSDYAKSRKIWFWPVM